MSGYCHVTCTVVLLISATISIIGGVEAMDGHVYCKIGPGSIGIYCHDNYIMAKVSVLLYITIFQANYTIECMLF